LIFSFFSWIFSKALLLFPYFSFHCLQFLFSLLQYSWLYLLSDYPNSFLTVNLSGNSPLLNTPSYSCLAMSSWSHWYSFLNSSIASFTFFKFSLPFQVSNFAINLFYLTRYLSFPLIHHLFRILSTSHSSSLSWLGKMAKLLFIFYFFSLLYRKECRKVSCHKCHIMWWESHMVMSHDRCGKVHRPYSSYISSV